MAQDIPGKPTQNPRAIEWDKLEIMVGDMEQGKFRWAELIAEGDFVRVTPSGKITQGHHRVAAAAIAGQSVPEAAVMRVPESIHQALDWTYTLGAR